MISSGYYPNCCGGVEVFTQALSEGLAKRGHTVTVWVPDDPAGVREYHGVQIRSIVPVTLKIGSFQFRNHVNRLLQMYNGFMTHTYRKLLVQEKPDVVHFHMPRTLSMSVMKAAELEHIPVISTLHEYFSLWNFDPFHKMEDVVSSKPQFYVEIIRHLHRRITRKAALVTSPLEYTFQKYSKEGYYRGCPYLYIPNALMPLANSLQEETKALHLKKTKPTKLLFIGRLMPFKGLQESIHAFSSEPELKNYELHIAGDGPMRPLAEEAAERCSNIFYHGYVIDEKKEALFRECDVLLFPTSELETFGIVAMEALQRNMPVLASRVAATQRMIASGNNGLFLKDLSGASFAEGILSITQEDTYAKLVHNISEQSYDSNYEKMIQAYEGAYADVKKLASALPETIRKSKKLFD